MDTEVILTCEVELGKPLHWFRNGKLLDPSDNHYKFKSKKPALKIESLRFNDTGIYECANSSSGDIKSSEVYTKIKLSVTKKIEMQNDHHAEKKASGNGPKFIPLNEKIDEPPSIVKTSGRSVRMKCRFEGEPQVLWFKDGHPFKERVYSELWKVDGGDLYLENLVPSDSGYYTCQAKNEYGTSDFTYSLRVQSKFY